MFTLSQINRFLLGKPLPTSAYSHERLTNFAALAILASDALSSVAYATEEILLVLVAAGSRSLGLSLPIAGGIILLLFVITLSYRQTIRAYPQGGSAYLVAKENLGLHAGLVAAASLLIDYILTVTVSISAGIAALTSAIPALDGYTIELCLIAVVLLMVANLRGVKEAGRIFMIPTYSFIISVFVLMGLGFYKYSTGQVIATVPLLPVSQPLSLFLILRAFAAGCTALTGVEAISDGVLVFKPPEWKNARTTLLWMGGILGLMFIGITYLTQAYHIIPEEGQTTVSLLAREIFGNGFFYYFLQLATLFILLLAANTSYADFPRLSYLVSRDGFLPRQLSLLGDRLVYANGIRLLSLCAAVLIIIFKGQVNALIPLYAVGVFTSFTLSQLGMVIHWFKSKSSGWQQSAVMNGVGALTTAIVLGVIIATKFLLGAWLVVLAIPLLVILFLKIHSHYENLAKHFRDEELSPYRCPLPAPDTTIKHSAIVLVGYPNRGTLEALDYARLVAQEIVAIHVDIGTTNQAALRRRWEELEIHVPLVILDSPYRSVVQPILKFVSEFEAERPHGFSTVIIPSIVTRYWWEELLHNQTALFIRQALRSNQCRIVTTVRYYV
ncbi:APC family permease [Planktothrix mougeotii]|uniref:APC family permease n=1 Tax=Planktothrix mougeotii LEGE 06226 TaxID=1828728 RepID=A0ABR9UII0_9CYAN|nr:APC family permease [Planktothrix mougeotii]MBE9145939.1 APC family permease [Planktothrix mougeotii LEGE 06226]